MEFKCSYDELVGAHKLVPHPNNPNKHSKEQIGRLSKIIDYQGQRSPVVVCKDTGFIVVGHGRLEAMKSLGWEKVAVNFQKFEDDAQRYAHMVADNAVAGWAELDIGGINLDIKELSLDLDLELYGLEKFELDVALGEGFMDEPLTDSQVDKLEKYLDKDFIEVKLFYSKDEYGKFTSNCAEAFKVYNTENISDIFLRMLCEKNSN